MHQLFWIFVTLACASPALAQDDSVPSIGTEMWSTTAIMFLILLCILMGLRVVTQFLDVSCTRVADVESPAVCSAVQHATPTFIVATTADSDALAPVAPGPTSFIAPPSEIVPQYPQYPPVDLQPPPQPVQYFNTAGMPPTIVLAASRV